MTDIKATYIVTGTDIMPFGDENCEAIEFKTERAALKDATQRLADSEGDDAEIWVWKLTHVLSKPDLDPVIDVIK